MIKQDDTGDLSDFYFRKLFTEIDRDLIDHKMSILKWKYKFNYYNNRVLSRIFPGSSAEKVFTEVDSAILFSAFARAQLRFDTNKIPFDDEIESAFEEIKERLHRSNYMQTLQLLCAMAILQPNVSKWRIQLVDCLHTWYVAQEHRIRPFRKVQKINVINPDEGDFFNDESSVYHASAVVDYLQNIKFAGLDEAHPSDHWIHRCMTNMWSELLVRSCYSEKDLSDEAIHQLAHLLKTLVFEILMQ